MLRPLPPENGPGLTHLVGDNVRLRRRLKASQVRSIKRRQCADNANTRADLAKTKLRRCMVELEAARAELTIAEQQISELLRLLNE